MTARPLGGLQNQERLTAGGLGGPGGNRSRTQGLAQRLTPPPVLSRLVASPAFRRWAATFPLTRPFARRRAQALFDLCAGFVYAQTLYACVQLDLFRLLAEGAQTAPQLAGRMALPPDRAETLLTAAAALRLVTRRGDRFGLGPLGAAMVGNDALAAMVAHHGVFYADMQDPVALLRKGGEGSFLAAYWAYAAAASPATLAQEAVAPYTALMAASQPMIAAEVLGAYDIGRHRCLLDVGAGDASFAIAAATRHPDLHAIAFDLPAVAAQAAARITRAGLEGRLRAAGGDMFDGALPTGADIASLVRVIHDHDDGAARHILRAVHTALSPNGTILLAEPMAGATRPEPAGDAYFGFYLLAMGSGRARTPESLKTMLIEAGFAHPLLVRTSMPMLTRLMVATKSTPA